MESKILRQISYLPEEIIIDILSRLPVKSLLRFKLTSKSWHSLISAKHFVRTHLETSEKNQNFAHHRMLSVTLEHNKYKAQYCSLGSLFFEPVTFASRGGIPVDESVDSLNVVGSCNGLVCIRMRNDYLLWNPSTRESRKLPDFDAKMSHGYITRDGVGFEQSSGDYKVHAVLQIQHQAIAKTYSLKTDSWTRTNKFKDYSLFFKSGNFVSGKLHWMCNKKQVWDRRWYISSFDLKNEVYGMVDQPEDFELDQFPTLGVLDGCLSVFYHYQDHDYRDLWVLKQYGVKDSWSKLFTFHDHHPYIRGLSTRLYVISKSHDGGVLIKYGKGLFVYNPKENCFWRPQMIGFDILCEVDVYVESLVSINVVDV